MSNDNKSYEEHNEFSSIFNIDEASIPDTVIERDPDTPKITEPVLTSDEAQRFLPKDAKKAMEKEKKAERKQQKKNLRRKKMIMLLSAAVIFMLTAGIIGFIITDAKTPTVSTEKPVIQTISRYHTENAVSVRLNNQLLIAFIDNDYDVHFIEKGQKTELSTSDGTLIYGTVSDIKEENPESVLIKNHYAVLTGTLPSTSVYAVYIAPTDTQAVTEEGLIYSAKVLTKTSEEALTLPSGAVCINGNQYFVWKYDAFRKTLKKQDVSIGISVDGTTEIIKGIKKSDRIAVSFSCNTEQLYDGIRVKNR